MSPGFAKPLDIGYFPLIEGGASSERRYGGRSATERRAARRERLLDAGLELFGTVGYGATTIESLCTEASLNGRYFYEHFRHREELLTAVYARQTWTALGAVRTAIDCAAPTDRLEAGLRAFVTTMLCDERGARVVYLETVGVSATLESERRRVRGEYVGLLARETGRLCRMADAPEEHRRAIAVALIGATDGLVVDWLASDRARPPGAIVDTLLTVFTPG